MTDIADALYEVVRGRDEGGVEEVLQGIGTRREWEDAARGYCEITGTAPPFAYCDVVRRRRELCDKNSNPHDKVRRECIRNLLTQNPTWVPTACGHSTLTSPPPQPPTATRKTPTPSAPLDATASMLQQRDIMHTMLRSNTLDTKGVKKLQGSLEVVMQPQVLVEEVPESVARAKKRTTLHVRAKQKEKARWIAVALEEEAAKRRESDSAHVKAKRRIAQHARQNIGIGGTQKKPTIINSRKTRNDTYLSNNAVKEGFDGGKLSHTTQYKTTRLQNSRKISKNDKTAAKYCVFPDSPGLAFSANSTLENLREMLLEKTMYRPSDDMDNNTYVDTSPTPAQHSPEDQLLHTTPTDAPSGIQPRPCHPSRKPPRRSTALSLSALLSEEKQTRRSITAQRAEGLSAMLLSRTTLAAMLSWAGLGQNETPQRRATLRREEGSRVEGAHLPAPESSAVLRGFPEVLLQMPLEEEEGEGEEDGEGGRWVAAS